MEKTSEKPKQDISMLQRDAVELHEMIEESGVLKVDDEVVHELFDIHREKGRDKFYEVCRDMKALADFAKEGYKSDLLYALPKKEQEMVRQATKGVELKGANWRKTMDELNGVQLKLTTFELAVKAHNQDKNTGNVRYLDQYIFDLDMAAALVQGMDPKEAGDYLHVNYNTRYSIAAEQARGLITQQDANELLATVNEDPLKTYTELQQRIKTNEEEERKNDEKDSPELLDSAYPDS
jgi:hypothetical protein